MANPNPSANRATPKAERHEDVLRPWPRKTPKRAKITTITTSTALIRSSRDHGTLPLFLDLENAATSQYNQKAPHPAAKTISTARTGGQRATVRTGRAQLHPVIAGQTWHWLDPVAGAARAAPVLRPGSRLAVVWNAMEPPRDLGAATATVAYFMVTLPPASEREPNTAGARPTRRMCPRTCLSGSEAATSAADRSERER